jgi:pimeloyl-ACP methyl ester carboxylesterase
LLTDQLAGDYTVIAPDLYGYGTSPEWTDEEALELEDEIELLQPVLDEIPGPFHLIGHSYGAAVAFKLALAMPARIRSLVVYEPVLFNLLFHSENLDAATEIWMVSDDVHWLLVDDRYADAARRFIDYWSGEGVWDSLPEWQREAIERRMKKVTADFDATLGNPTPLEAYRELDIPLLFLYGLQSPRSTQQIAEWMAQELPNVEVRGLLPLGHMGPVSHADGVNRMISSFLKGQPTGVLPHQIRRK